MANYQISVSWGTLALPKGQLTHLGKLVLPGKAPKGGVTPVPGPSQQIILAAHPIMLKNMKKGPG